MAARWLEHRSDVHTVRFWAAGFCGFVGCGAFRSLGGILAANAYHVPRLYMAALSASIFLMFILSIRFASKKWQITSVDRISVVIAASSMLVSFLMGNTYEGVLMSSAPRPENPVQDQQTSETEDCSPTVPSTGVPNEHHKTLAATGRSATAPAESMGGHLRTAPKNPGSCRS